MSSSPPRLVPLDVEALEASLGFPDLEELDAQLLVKNHDLRIELAALKATLEEKEVLIKEKDRRIQEMEKRLEEKDKRIEEKNEQIQDKHALYLAAKSEAENLSLIATLKRKLGELVNEDFEEDQTHKRLCADQKPNEHPS
ncbi:hypothetical protein BU24DRAFT_139045 [Aaosphaeria arxii CBS 175.79]|uniref:Uncharacterized protein n=1 Tax=Aaosphaeria arxii CBS 175.79 TaxID=1450172 RepID=A0A6A5XVI2_9PLEO|nr:uncharacterized protein BU24DRAFT_139045 [Aaosphaeria arxii CBS 175.79]KAF2016827.1 hypothetical protein BU24DRAFT_139045 [Aaosphaeria arxii CBS 175.79]